MLFDILFQYTGKFMFESRLVSASFSVLFSFLAAMALFQPYIRFLQKAQFSSELTTTGTQRQPVMPAGVLFLFIISISVLIFARMNSYMVSALAIYVFFSIIGAVDDVAKVINKGRLSRGEITKEEFMYKADGISGGLRLTLYLLVSLVVAAAAYKFIPDINGHITIPFVSVEKFFPYLPIWFFIPFITLIIAVMANGVNFTDGFDTLAGVPLITCLMFVGLISYVSSHAGWSAYLGIPYLPGVIELLPLIGAAVGFKLLLWTMENIEWGMQAPPTLQVAPAVKQAYPWLGWLVAAGVFIWAVQWRYSGSESLELRALIVLCHWVHHAPLSAVLRAGVSGTLCHGRR